MTFARFLLELRRRSAALPADRKRPEAIERIARKILDDGPDGEHSDQIRRIFAAFLGLGEGDEFDAALLNHQMTPELVFRLDMMMAELLELGQANEAAVETRRALIRRIY